MLVSRGHRSCSGIAAVLGWAALLGGVDVVFVVTVRTCMMAACERGTAQIKLRKKTGFGAEPKLRVVHEHGDAAGASCLIPQGRRR